MIKPSARLPLALLAALSLPSFAAESLTQKQLDNLAKDLKWQYEVKGNFPSAGQAGKEGMHAVIHLKNQSSEALPKGANAWRLYFHSVRSIKAEGDVGLRLTHVNGDLYELAPTDSFAGLPAGGALDVGYYSGEWAVSYSDFMPRAFIAQAGLTPQIIASTQTEDLASFVAPFKTKEQQLRFPKDQYSVVTPQDRYQENLAVNRVKVSTDDLARTIVPTPQSVRWGKSTINLAANWQIQHQGRLVSEAKYLQSHLAASGLSLGLVVDSAGATGQAVVLQVNSKLPAESYTISAKSSQITIQGGDAAGVFYGVQSLLSLLPVQGAMTIPEFDLQDAPRYGWRGMHYDMGRNFHGKAVTLRLIEEMAKVKLNKLHLHLTEDEGWRLEIPGLPELTSVGGNRCFDVTEERCLLTQLGTGPSTSGSGNGFYTRADFVEILKYAAERHIEVIPEADMPGHARAAIKAMNARYKRLMAAGDKTGATQYLLADPEDKSVYASVQNYTDNAINLCLPSAYNFVDKVVYELQQMYRDAGLKLTTFHMGGDEVGKGAWTESPACKALFAKGEAGLAGVADLKPHFVSKLAELTAKRGLSLAGWEDGLMYDPENPFNRASFANEKVIANCWDNIWEWGVADRAYRLANAGYQVVLSPGTHLYFDHPYEANPNERGYYWATRYTDTAKVFGFMPDNYYANADKTREGAPITDLEALVGREMPALKKPENILGMQGQVWTETIRTSQQLEQMIYPRVQALGERAWHKAAWEGDKPDLAARNQDWAKFAWYLSQKALPRLAINGATAYVPPPGMLRDAEGVKLNASLPGLVLEYSLDKGATWQVYSAPVSVSPSASLWARSRSGDLISRVEQLSPQ